MVSVSQALEPDVEGEIDRPDAELLGGGETAMIRRAKAEAAEPVVLLLTTHEKESGGNRE